MTINATPLRPPLFGPQLANYPALPQVCRVYGATSGGSSSARAGSSGGSGPNLYTAYVQQWTPGPVLRDREACYVLEPNGTQLQNGYYLCRLMGTHPAPDPASVPLYATCIFLGTTGNVVGTTNFGTSASKPVSPPGVLSPPTLLVPGPPTWTPSASTYPIEIDSNSVIWRWNGATWVVAGSCCSPTVNTLTLSGNTNNYPISSAPITVLNVTPTANGFLLTGLTGPTLGQTVVITNQDTTYSFDLPSGSGSSTYPFTTPLGSTVTLAPGQTATFTFNGTAFLQTSSSLPVSSGITGSLTNGRVTLSSGASTVSDSPNLAYDGATLTATSNSANIQEWVYSGNTTLRVGTTGYLICADNSLPADGDLAAAEVAWWFDSTNGAAKVKYKGKQNDGTVVTFTIGNSSDVPYTPTTSADWDGTDPTNVLQALDRCAALLKVLNGGTGP